MLGIAAALADGPLMSQLVSVGVSALAYDGLERITPTLNIEEKGAGDPVLTGPASRAQVSALIEALLDEAECRQAAVRAMHFERMTQIEDAHAFMNGRWGLFSGSPILGTLAPHLLLLGPAWVLIRPSWPNGQLRWRMRWPRQTGRRPLPTYLPRSRAVPKSTKWRIYPAQSCSPLSSARCNFHFGRPPHAA